MPEIRSRFKKTEFSFKEIGFRLRWWIKVIRPNMTLKPVRIIQTHVLYLNLRILQWTAATISCFPADICNEWDVTQEGDKMRCSCKCSYDVGSGHNPLTRNVFIFFSVFKSKILPQGQKTMTLSRGKKRNSIFVIKCVATTICHWSGGSAIGQICGIFQKIFHHLEFWQIVVEDTDLVNVKAIVPVTFISREILYPSRRVFTQKNFIYICCNSSL